MKLSYLMAIIMAVSTAVISMAIKMYGTANQYYFYGAAIFVMGFFVVLNQFSLEKVRMFNEEYITKLVNDIEERKAESKKQKTTIDRKQAIANYIIAGINAEREINELGSSLMKSGYKQEEIKQVISNLIEEKVISFEPEKKPELQPEPFPEAEPIQKPAAEPIQKPAEEPKQKVKLPKGLKYQEFVKRHAEIVKKGGFGAVSDLWKQYKAGVYYG